MNRKAGITDMVTFVILILVMILLYFLITNGFDMKATATAMLGLFGQ